MFHDIGMDRTFENLRSTGVKIMNNICDLSETPVDNRPHAEGRKELISLFDILGNDDLKT